MAGQEADREATRGSLLHQFDLELREVRPFPSRCLLNTCVQGMPKRQKKQIMYSVYSTYFCVVETISHSA